VELCNIKSRGT